MDPFRKIRGFTLLEVLVVLGIFMSTVFFGIAVSIPKIQQNRTEAVLSDITSLMFLYQQNAYSGKNGKSYGIHFESDKYTMFTGETYAAAETFDTIMLPADTTISAISFNDLGSDVIFTEGDLHPSTSGYVRMTNGATAYILDINTEGFIRVNEE